MREGAYSQLDLVAIGCDVICAIFFVSILPTIGGLSSPATLHKYHFPVAGTDETLQTRGLADLGKIELPTSLETNASARERRGKVSPRRCRAVVQREQSVTLHSRGLPLVGSRLPVLIPVVVDRAPRGVLHRSSDGYQTSSGRPGPP